MMSNVSRAARFAAAYAALMPAHDLADHVAQTDHQAAGKAASWSAMAGHVGSYHVVQLAAVLVLRHAGVRPSWARTAAAITLSVGTHTLLDRRWPVIEILRRSGSAPFSRTEHGRYVADQALHHAVLAVCAVILAGGR